MAPEIIENGAKSFWNKVKNTRASGLITNSRESIKYKQGNTLKLNSSAQDMNNHFIEGCLCCPFQEILKRIEMNRYPEASASDYDSYV